jgi:hypothetical protein
MPGGHDDTLPREEMRDGRAGILLGSKGKELHKSGSGIEKTLSVVHIRRTDAQGLVSSDETGRRIKERSLDVKTGNDSASQFILLAKPNDLGEFGSETFNAVGNEGDENAVHTIFD